MLIIIIIIIIIAMIILVNYMYTIIKISDYNIN